MKFPTSDANASRRVRYKPRSARTPAASSLHVETTAEDQFDTQGGRRCDIWSAQGRSAREDGLAVSVELPT